MKTSNTRIASLREMIVLEEKRADLQSQITSLDERLSALQDTLYGSSAASVVTVTAPKATPGRKPATKVKAALPAQRKPRGALKNQILESLQAAGAKGATVQDIASRIGTKSPNVYSWFSANVKKVAGLKKVGQGRYALTEASPAKETAPEPKALPKTKRGKAAKAPKAVKAAKASKPAAAPEPAKRGTRRGALKDQILEALKEAGESGITIKDLAEKLNVKYKNLYIWFVTTGKRIGGIQKVGPACYRLAAA